MIFLVVVKLVAGTVIVCGLLARLVPAGFSAFAFDCIVVCGMCLYILSAVSASGLNFELNLDTAYDYVEKYTEYVEVQQKKLFDDIATKERHNVSQQTD